MKPDLSTDHSGPSRRPELSAALVSGPLASLASSAVLMLAGKRELGDPAAPLNGPSQWVLGQHAPYKGGFSVRHTVLGYLIHHLTSIFWAALYEKARPGRHPLAAAAVTSAGAAFVDYNLMPRRFTPGFERRLSTRALVGVYAAFAAGLAAPHLLSRK